MQMQPSQGNQMQVQMPHLHLHLQMHSSTSMHHSRLTTLGNTSSLRATTRSPSSSSCTALATSGRSKCRLAAPANSWSHPAIKYDAEKITGAYVLSTWLINDTTNQSLYRGIGAHLHLEALSSPYRSINHDLLRNLDNPLLACSMIKL